VIEASAEKKQMTETFEQMLEKGAGNETDREG
jgi:hypothetical protein